MARVESRGKWKEMRLELKKGPVRAGPSRPLQGFLCDGTLLESPSRGM